MEHEQLANCRWIGPDYLTTLQQPIIEGRTIDAHDCAAYNAVISEVTAKAVWACQSPINRQFKRNGYTFTVVRVLADAHNNSLRIASANMIYIPYWDKPPTGAFFFIRTRKDTALLTSQVRNAIWSFAPDFTITHIHTINAQLNESLARSASKRPTDSLRSTRPAVSPPR
jgi:hypothetical protein